MNKENHNKQQLHLFYFCLLLLLTILRVTALWKGVSKIKNKQNIKQ